MHAPELGGKPLTPLLETLETLETFNLGACRVGIHAGSDASMDLANDLITVPLDLHIYTSSSVD